MFKFGAVSCLGTVNPQLGAYISIFQKRVIVETEKLPVMFIEHYWIFASLVSGLCSRLR